MRIFLVLVLIGASLNLAACSNTARGFGADMEKTGEKIQKSF